MRPRVLAFVLLGLLPGCGAGGPESSAPEGDPSTSEDLAQSEMLKLELMLADRRSATLVQRSGPSSWSAAFAPDGSLIRDGVGEIQGRDALHEAFMSDIQSGAVAALEWLPDRAEVSRDGVLGYTVGQYATLGVDSAGVRTVERGTYVRIWERQPDGEWKVDIEIRTPTGEPEADTPPAGELEP